MCDDYNEGAVPYREERRRARKRYECHECDGPIPRGVEHVYIAGRFDGDWFSGRVHLECNEIRHLVHAGLCGGHGLMLLGGLREELEEHDEAFSRWEDDTGYVVPGFAELLKECAGYYRAMEATP